MTEPASPEPLLLIRRIRLGLGVCTIFWAIFLGILMAGDAVAMEIPAEDYQTVLMGHIGGLLLSGFGATALVPNSPGRWAVAVTAASAQLVTCLLLPAGVYLIWLLFQRPVLRACLRRGPP